jgi:hypothetical protein
MIPRVLMFSVFVSSFVIAQAHQPIRLRGQAPVEAQPVSAAVPANTPTPLVAPVDLPPDSAVMTVDGICGPQADKSAATSTCVTTVTREQFEVMISAMSFNSQLLKNPVAARAFAESYVQALIMADAAEKAGLDKDPQFEELMKIVRLRTLADAYRRSQQAHTNVSSEDVEAYYKEHTADFEQLELDRIFIPRANAKTTQSGGDFEKRAASTAAAIRESAAKGDDMSKLQVQAYKALGLTPPLTTDMGAVRRGSLPRSVEQDVFALHAGEVSQLQSDATGFTIYKVRSRTAMPIERIKDEITRAIQRKRTDDDAKALAARVHSTLNEQFFSPRALNGKASAPEAFVQKGMDGKAARSRP